MSSNTRQIHSHRRQSEEDFNLSRLVKHYFHDKLNTNGLKIDQKFHFVANADDMHFPFDCKILFISGLREKKISICVCLIFYFPYHVILNYVYFNRFQGFPSLFDAAKGSRVFHSLR